jgi:hypothetical protein
MSDRDAMSASGDRAPSEAPKKSMTILLEVTPPFTPEGVTAMTVSSSGRPATREILRTVIPGRASGTSWREQSASNWRASRNG